MMISLSDSIKIPATTGDPTIPSTPQDDTEYLDETDNLLHCRKCGGAREVILQNYMGTNKPKKVRCICQCQEDDYEHKILMRRIYENIERNETRSAAIGFPRYMLKDSTFENQKGGDDKAIEICRNYVKNFRDMLHNGSGLLLYGETGTGKTYLAACIVNELQKLGYFIPMTDASHLSDAMSGYRVDRSARRAEIASASCVVIDDLGSDKKAKSAVYDLINDRYFAKKPMIITTNIDLLTMKNCTTVEDARPYKRILERCYPVAVRYTEMRKQATERNYYETRDILLNKGDGNE